LQVTIGAGNMWGSPNLCAGPIAFSVIH